MVYSDFSIDQFDTNFFNEISNQLLEKTQDEETKRKMIGILYEGGFDNFSVNGDKTMEKPILLKNNPDIEINKRINMAFLLLKNPEIIDLIRRYRSKFFSWNKWKCFTWNI